MNFKQPARALEAEITQHRHWLHRHAELSFQEAETGRISLQFWGVCDKISGRNNPIQSEMGL